MQIIAHRCGTDRYHEQTIAAARHSLACGADYVEVDIRFTRDHKPVVIHDPTPESLYGVSTPVCELTETEFLALRRTKDPSVCGHSFRHYLDCGIDRMLFHCKEGGQQLCEIVDLCREYGILDRVVFGPQDPEDVRILKGYAPDVAVLAFMRKREDTKTMADAGADIIRLWDHWATPEAVAEVKEAGKKLWIMAKRPTVGEIDDKPKAYADYAEWGADGVLVNEVEPALLYYRAK